MWFHLLVRDVLKGSKQGSPFLVMEAPVVVWRVFALGKHWVLGCN